MGGATPGFHEYEAFFLYLGDAALLGLLGTFFYYKRHRLRQFLKASPALFYGLIGFFLLAIISFFFAPSPGVSFYVFLRMATLFLMAWFIVPFIFSSSFHRIWTIMLIVALCADQALAATLQFIKQGALGLGFLGESPLDVMVAGTSSVVIEGAKLLRGYGTFPHPNILSMFLVLGLICISYLYVLADTKLYHWDYTTTVSRNAQKFFGSQYFWGRLVLAILFFLTSVGLVLTFSRAGWIVAAVSILVFLGLALIAAPRAALRYLVLVVASTAAVYLLLSPFIAPRAASLTPQETAINYRLQYNQLALDLIKEKPLGVGLGNQVLYSVKSRLYQDRGLTRAWEWEPVHNIYLLVAVELGVAGFLVFGFFLIYLFWRLLWRAPSLERALAGALFVGVLVFGLFDHFFWDLQPGRLMFWLVLGLVFSQVMQLPKQELYRS